MPSIPLDTFKGLASLPVRVTRTAGRLAKGSVDVGLQVTGAAGHRLVRTAEAAVSHVTKAAPTSPRSPGRPQDPNPVTTICRGGARARPGPGGGVRDGR